MRFLKSTIILVLFSVLIFLIILPGVSATNIAVSGNGSGSLSFVIIAVGVVYISSIAWYLNKKTGKDREFTKELEKYNMESKKNK